MFYMFVDCARHVVLSSNFCNLFHKSDRHIKKKRIHEVALNKLQILPELVQQQTTVAFVFPKKLSVLSSQYFVIVFNAKSIAFALREDAWKFSIRLR